MVNPVTFPPGLARLATNPAPSGSTAQSITIGIFVVARLASAMMGLIGTTITSTFSRTSR